MNPPAPFPSGDPADWLQLLTETARLGYWRHDLATHASEWSPGCAALLGLAQSTGLDYARVVAALHPADARRLDPYFLTPAATAAPAAFTEEARLVAASDDDERSARWVQLKGRVVASPETGGARVEGVLLDITDRKRSEMLSRRAEERLHQAAEAAQVVFWETDLRAGRTTCSHNAARIWGFTEGPSEAFFERVHPEDRDFLRPRPYGDHGGERAYSREYRVLTVAGQWRWLHARGDVVCDEQGAPVRMAGVSVDITERKHAEQALRASNERLERAQLAARLGTWDWDLRSQRVVWSDGIYDLFGIPRGQFEPSFERGLEFVVPEDAATLAQDAQAAISRGGEFSLGFRIRRPDGAIRWIESIGRIETDASGEPTHVLGINIDVTERKKAERELRRSEREFSAMFDLADVGAAQSDAAGKFVRVNASFCAFTGYTEDELLRMTYWDITHPDDLAIDREGMERVLQHQADHWCIEKRYLRKDGSVRWGLLSAGLLRDDDGRHVFNIGVVIDITDRKRDEEALRESRAREHAYLEHLPVGVWFLDASGNIFYGNPAARQIWVGERYVPPSQFHEYKGWWHGTDRRIRAEEWAAAVAIREGKTTLEEVVDIECFDGTRKTMLNSAVPVRDAQGGVIGAVVFNQDITRIKRTEADLVEAQTRLRSYAQELERIVAERTAELRETNGQLETFVYSIAHDLRAPLRSLTGFSQLLVEDYSKRLDAEGVDMLRRIQASSEFMDKLVLDLLAFGRTARAQMELGAVSPAVAWDVACFQCADEIQSTRARIEVVEPLPAVIAHEATLGQMLANLLGNALKFVVPGVPPRVRFRAETRDAFVRLWVEDNGTGIAPEQHERVFRVFERLHGSTHPGTGVGLAIVRKGAERLGGAAGVESKPGAGSRFWIDLPRDPASAPTAAPHNSA